MRRRILSILLILCLLYAMAGCASMLDGPYVDVTDYEENPAETPPVDAGQTVSSYDGLRQRILSLVNEHATSGKIGAASYNQEDLLSDLGKACEDIKLNTPIGAYTVEYISYPPNPVKMVSYYEVDISIEYKRTQEQVDAIKALASAAQLKDAIAELLGGGGETLAVQMYSSIIDEAQIKTYLRQAFFENPLAAPALPELSATPYPATGLYKKIFEITLKYGMSTEERTQELTEMRQAVENLVSSSGVKEQSGYDAVYALLQAFVSSCEYNHNSAAPSAYGALCGGGDDGVKATADSYGMALAFLALAQAVHINCRVVDGTLDGEAHAWNLVQVDGQWYHLDVSTAEPGNTTLLRGDTSMRKNYVWSASDTPACPADYTAEAVQTTEGAQGG